MPRIRQIAKSFDVRPTLVYTIAITVAIAILKKSSITGLSLGDIKSIKYKGASPLVQEPIAVRRGEKATQRQSKDKPSMPDMEGDPPTLP
jgi:hypothetical protein